MSRLLLLAAALGALTGCAEYGYAQGPYGSRTPDSRDRDRGRYEDYSRTGEYRRITSDAADYARRLDAALRVGSGQERRIRDLLVDRTARLLQRTSPRDHRAVYPFPRRFSGDSRAARSFWSGADRDIERILGRRDADLYRRYVRAGGRVDTRYDDRQYDDRRDDDRGRDDGERRSDDRRGNGRDGRRDDRRSDARQPDRDGPRPGETLDDWYRRQAQNPR